MEAIWFGLLAGMIAVYAALDGFDLGVGIVHLFVARTDAERRESLAAIGPVWNGNEVWLVAAGGTMVLAFPRAYATGFSGFYLPLMIVLWLLILRGVSIELRSHVPEPLWATFWDAVFMLSSALLAIVFGAAVGNLIRGVPLDESQSFTLPWFADATSPVGVLDAYTVGLGLFGLMLLAMHGALFLAWRTQGKVAARAWGLGARISASLALTWLAVTYGTFRVWPELFFGVRTNGWAWAGCALLVAAWVSLGLGILRGRRGVAFAGSLMLILGLLGTLAAAMYPVLLRSAGVPEFSLTASQAAAGEHSLRTGLKWWLFGIPLACGYFAFLFRAMRAKPPVQLDRATRVENRESKPPRS